MDFIDSHWVSKHFQDFEQDSALRTQTIAFLDDITCSPNLLPGEHRAASQLLRLLCREDIESNQLHLEKLLKPSKVNGYIISSITIANFNSNVFQSPSKESIETLSALEIAEQMTYLDHQIFISIRSECVISIYSIFNTKFQLNYFVCIFMQRVSWSSLDEIR